MPPLDRSSYLLRWLLDLGLFEHGANGPVAISNKEVIAWQELSGNEVHPWEASLLRKASSDYVGGVLEFQDPNLPQPWVPPVVTQPDYRKALAVRISSAFGSRVRPEDRKARKKERKNGSR